MIDHFVEKFSLFLSFYNAPYPLYSHGIDIYKSITQSYFLYLYYSLILVDHRTCFMKYIYYLLQF